MVVGQHPQSGAMVVLSGPIFSGRLVPTGGLQICNVGSGGNIYVAFSGGGPPLSGNFMTMNSGQLPLSGGCLSGMLDGMPLAPGQSYFIPKIAFTNTGATSGLYNLFALADQAASGVSRLFFEFF